jgi:hypothetical protein
MAETIILRPGFGKVLTIATAAVIASCVVALVAEGNAVTAVRFAPVLLTVAYLAWLGFWAPAVEVSDGGVTLINALSTVTLPWPSIQRIDTRYALTLFTSYGRFVAWAAPAAGRHRFLGTAAAEAHHLPESTMVAGTIGPGDLPTTDSGDAAAIVRRRWDALRDAGHLDEGARDPDLRPVHWSRGKLAMLVALVLLSAGCLLFVPAR